MRNIFSALVGVVVLAGCTVTEPVVVIGDHGETLRGTTTASLFSGGSFTVTDGRLTCGGSYDALDQSPTITMQVLCSDGRKGIIIATRDPSGRSGHGTVRLNDGMSGTFIFGPSAANF